MTTLARAYGVALEGLTGTPVEVQTHVGPGIVGTTLVGLPDASLREAKERVRAALFSCGIPTLNRRVTVNLSPADLPKSGSAFDMAIAVSMLVARGLMVADATIGTVYYAELGLDGSLQPVPGVLSAALLAKDAGFDRIVVPPSMAGEARLVAGLEVIPVGHLEWMLKTFSPQRITGAKDIGYAWKAVVEAGERFPQEETHDQAGRYVGHDQPSRHQPARDRVGAEQGQFDLFGRVGGAHLTGSRSLDLADVRGQDDVIEALALAAVGAHHVLLRGIPGVGKTMLAARLPTLLPDLEPQEAITVTAIRSLAAPPGTAANLAKRPPLQVPHHSATLVALVGGGNPIRPGAVSLAHGGVLLLDEAPEFQPRTLDALRQPLEAGSITVHRARQQAQFPARFQLVMTANPCPCGGGADSATSSKGCTCSWAKKKNYWSRLSGPLLDRIDLNVEVSRPHRSDLAHPSHHTGENVRGRVAEARERTKRRLRDTPWKLNSEVPGRYLRSSAYVPKHYLATLDRSVDSGLISLRGADRILRLAWSAADLGGRGAPNANDFALAMKLRGEMGTQDGTIS